MHLELEVPDPMLWWLNGAEGRSCLTRLEVRLIRGRNFDRRALSIGLTCAGRP